MVLGAVAVSLVQTPVYEASADVLLQPRASEQIFSPGADQVQFPLHETRVNNAVAVMESRPVLDAERQWDPARRKQQPAASRPLTEWSVVRRGHGSLRPATIYFR